MYTSLDDRWFSVSSIDALSQTQMTVVLESSCVTCEEKVKQCITHTAGCFLRCCQRERRTTSCDLCHTRRKRSAVQLRKPSF